MGVFKKGADANRLDTIIGPGTICEGSITSKESICVEGTVRGKIICEGSVIVGEKGKATLMISSSASKVPSAKFNGNDKLTVTRADAAKQAVTNSVSSKGIGADKLNFADMSTLVRGPEYQNDAQQNKDTYRNYQYVKIIVK